MNHDLLIDRIIADNHSTNVSAFNILKTRFPSGCFDIQHSHNSTKTYWFFNNVHLVKNIRNNLLNCKKVVFPAFSFSLNDQLIASSENGYRSWRDFHDLYEEDTKRKAFLRMAPKITVSALLPGNNKQKVALALAIFHETTKAAFKIYKPARKDAVGFLTLLSSWWAMINSKQRYNQ